MGKELAIDFRQMPWSNSLPSWKHHGGAAEEAIQAAIRGERGRAVVICPASANEHLRATLTVDAKGFTGNVIVSGPDDLALADLLAKARAGRLSVYSHELAIQYLVGEPGAVTMAVQLAHADKEDARFQVMLDILWDLQLAALAVLEDVFGICQTEQVQVQQPGMVQSLLQESGQVR